MMATSIFDGERVRLVALDPEEGARPYIRWCRDSEYQRLADDDAIRLWELGQEKEFSEKLLESVYLFMIRTRAEDKVIGTLDLHNINWSVGDAWVGIGVGEREYWGRGYGTEAMQLIVRYGFEQLNLRRISLTVFEYNQRAVHSYQKIGFQEEGRMRQWVNREGRRWDLIYMGLLRADWEALNPRIAR